MPLLYYKYSALVKYIFFHQDAFESAYAKIKRFNALRQPFYLRTRYAVDIFVTGYQTQDAKVKT